MTFAPFIGGGGYVGWKLLTRTMDRQMQALAQSPAHQRDEAYFRDKIGKAQTAADLVADRRLLRVALGAFGLENDVGNRAFIRRILEDGTLRPDALAHKLADKRYLEFSRAFGFDLKPPRSTMSDFADKILSSYKVRKFEAAVGAVDDGMRLVMTARRELPGIVTGTATETTKWFKILGSPPLRKFVEGALGLPSSFGAIDLDQQVTSVRAKAERLLGSSDPSVLQDPDKLDKMIRVFLARGSASGMGLSQGQMALHLLGGGEG